MRRSRPAAHRYFNIAATPWVAIILTGIVTLAGCSDDASEGSVFGEMVNPAVGDTAENPVGNSTPNTGVMPPGPSTTNARVPAAGTAGAGSAEPAMPAEGPSADDASGDADDQGEDPATDDQAEEPATLRPPSTDLMFDVTVENPEVEPYFNIYRPTDMQAAVDATGGPLPVAVWASGGCFRADFAWAALLERWAAGGYVVLGLTPGPDASVPGTTTAVEHGQLIDWAVGQTDFPEMLDLDRVVATGNSCGGVTALEMTSMDDRVASVFVLSGSSAIGAANTAVMAGVTVPVGFVVGSATEDIAAGPAQMDYDLLTEGIAGMLVNRSTGDHVLVSTGEAVLPEVAEIALNWMDFTLYGTPEAATALESANVCDTCTPGDWNLKQKHWDSLQP